MLKMRLQLFAEPKPGEPKPEDKKPEDDKKGDSDVWKAIKELQEKLSAGAGGQPEAQKIPPTTPPKPDEKPPEAAKPDEKPPEVKSKSWVNWLLGD